MKTKYMNRSALIFCMLLIVALFTIAPSAAYAEDAESVAAEINTYGNGGGTGTPLSASVGDENVVTVTGSVKDANIRLIVFPDPDVTIIWSAALVGATSNNQLQEDALVYIAGMGAFEMLDGQIEQNGLDNALTTAGDVLIIRSSISATSGRAIYAEGNIEAVGSMISADGPEGRAIVLTRKGFAMEGGRIDAKTGSAVFAATDIRIDAGEISTEAGTALTAFNGNVSLSGGTINAINGTTIEARAVFVNSGSQVAIINAGSEPAIRITGLGSVWISDGDLFVAGDIVSGGNGINADPGAKVIVNGAIRADSYGIVGQYNSSITVNGSISAGADGVNASSCIVNISGDINSGNVGVSTTDSAFVRVTGSVKSSNFGVYASAGSTVHIHGNVESENNNFGSSPPPGYIGIIAGEATVYCDHSTVKITGNVISQKIGVYGVNRAEVVVGREIQVAETYIRFCDYDNIGNEITILAISGNTPTSKPGYKEYTDGSCFVWVKDSAATGDVTGDGKIDMQDVLLIYQCFRGRITLSMEQLQAADVNRDGVVDMQDVLLVYQYFRGRIDGFV